MKYSRLKKPEEYSLIELYKIRKSLDQKIKAKTKLIQLLESSKHFNEHPKKKER